MESTRRKFLCRAAAVAVSTQVPLLGMAQTRLASHPPGPESEAADPLAGVTAQTFQAWVGSQFQATLKGQPAVTLTLAAVTELETPSPASASRKLASLPQVTSFALRFSKTGPPLTQETYTLQHEWLGTFPLLLVPSGLHTSPATCSALFTALN